MCRIISFIILTILFTSSTLKKSSVKDVVTKKDVKLFEKIANSSGRPVYLIVRHDGYPSEMHNVTTQDGYKINLLRIPYGKSKLNPKILRRPVLIICSYIDPLMACLNLQEDSLPYVLADAGFDVWIGDFRGTNLSSHVKYNKTDPKFWDYSHDEVGYYDIPAFIDYILGLTGRRRLYYVGISYGTQVICVALASRPEYNQKLRKIAFLAPTVVAGHSKSKGFMYSAMLSGLTGDVLGKTPRKFPGVENWGAEYHRLCNANSTKLQVCPTFYSKQANLLANPEYEDRVKYRNLMAGRRSTSMKMYVHFFQQLRNAKFAHYDYGGTENQKRYGTKKPPLYDLKKVSVPSITVYSDGDEFAPPEVNHYFCNLDQNFQADSHFNPPIFEIRMLRLFIRA
ncbi:unnamed protein product [Allacma fusca]|uniref:Lipase n=1 Tax=Allacma fusca TaxID=39272 RepID=A0A8J2PJZ9_9HEXA|nr:unnamed protein product [Allacma fusca]